MTEKSVVENNQQRWVELRSKCTVETVFEDLVKTIEKDVKSFNRLHPTRVKEKGEFACAHQSTSTVNIGIPHAYSSNTWVDNQLIRLEKHEDKIFVYQVNAVLFEIVPKWNKDKLICELHVNGTVYSKWEVSQMAIGDLLFPVLN